MIWPYLFALIARPMQSPISMVDYVNLLGMKRPSCAIFQRNIAAPSSSSPSTRVFEGRTLTPCWADIDWNTGVLTIHETKAGERRRIPMNSTVAGLLSSLKAESQAHPAERVFCFGSRYIRRIFEETVKAAGLAPFRFHDCRHTFASRLAMQGTNDRTLMVLGGRKAL
jgi:hypothetical protein